MLGKEQTEKILAQVLDNSQGLPTEALLLAHDSALTRFAENTIHQNVREKDAALRVRVIYEQRTGVASGNDISADGIAALVEKATQLAKLQPPDPQFPGLPQPQTYAAVAAFDGNTANCSPDRRARLVGGVINRAQASGLRAAGALETAAREIAIANSNGLSAYHAYTSAEFSTVIMAEDSSGYGSETSGKVADLNIDAAGQRAINKAIRGRRPRQLSAGHYPVLLEADATVDILGQMGGVAFGATAIEEGSSFLAGHFGETMLHPSLTITDNGLNPAAIPLPFDYEGVTRQPVTIIADGVVRNVVHDSYSAAKAKVQSTGHALPMPNPEGPYPMHLSLQPGQATLEQLIAGMKNGLLITRFHYTRVVHPLSVSVTGMTRDGTFYIENGEIAYPVRNLRFTQSYVEALRQPVAVGSEARLCGEYGAYIAPPIYLPDFAFTGVTDF